MRARVLLKLAHACLLKPNLRVGQILADAVETYTAANVRNDLYYVDNATLLHALREFNKEAL